MGKIKQLSAHEVQKIAAGEVVERPINVVKELLENALDSGADQITLYIEDGGKKLIRVVDNGCGMSVDDAKMSINHHATSKISTVLDLETILSFGFRGEALSSISSVSNVILTTKEKSAETGTTLNIKEGEIVQETVVGCNSGTDISIFGLFENIPARKKFLKTKETEWRKIAQLFEAFCLDYFDIHFKLYHQNKLIYNCPKSSDIVNRLAQVFDQNLVKSILKIKSKNLENKFDLKISGAIANPKYSRYDRNQIFLFVNKRWVKNYKLSQAIIRGYQNILQPGKYPAAFVFISIDPKYIDINIHPKKEEILFLHPKIVESLLTSEVKQTLKDYVDASLGLTSQDLTSNFSSNSSSLNRDQLLNSFEKSISGTILNQETNQETNNVGSSPDNINNISNKYNFLKVLDESFLPIVTSVADLKSEKFDKIDKTDTENQNEQNIVVNKHIDPNESRLEYKLIGQVLKTYILIETQEGLVFIDQHAAHERVLYEKISQKFDNSARIRLIFPQVISLSQDEVISIGRYLDIFEKFGFIISEISSQELVVKETPVFLKNQPITDIVKEIIGIINKSKQTEVLELRKILQEKIHAQVSCKSAIKAGDVLSLEKMHEIIKELYSAENNLTCPHGRPTISTTSKAEIEKNFKRDYRQKKKID